MYDALAVLRVYRQGKHTSLRSKDIWLHLGYGNLNSYAFYNLPLEKCAKTVFVEVASHINLQAVAKATHWWDSFDGPIDHTKNYDMALWTLSTSTAKVRLIFAPNGSGCVQVRASHYRQGLAGIPSGTLAFSKAWSRTSAGATRRLGDRGRWGSRAIGG